MTAHIILELGITRMEFGIEYFLEAEFKTSLNHGLTGYPDLQKILTGNWTSTAWAGILNESWTLGQDGHMSQSSQYLEDGIVLYESSIQKLKIIGKDIVLFSVIKDNDPKIFKATAYSKNQIIFENTEYSNPNKVVYDFGPDGAFNRTISGFENAEPTTYTFEFRSVD